MTNPIRPGWLGHIEFGESLPNYLFLKILQTGRTYFCLLFPSSNKHREKIRLIHGPLGLHFLTKGFPVDYESDELIPPLTIQLLHSKTTFSGDLHTSLLQQTGPLIMAKYFIPDLPSNSWTFEFTLLDQGFTFEYELYELIPPLIIQWLHSWTTSLPQQPGLHIYGWTFIPVLKSATQYLPCQQRRISRSDI